MGSVRARDIQLVIRLENRSRRRGPLLNEQLPLVHLVIIRH